MLPALEILTSSTPASELLVRQREHRLTADGDRACQCGCLRQQALGVEPRGGDLAAIEACVTLVLREQARSDLRAARELPASRHQTPQSQVRYGSCVRGTRRLAVRGHHPIDRTCERGG